MNLLKKLVAVGLVLVATSTSVFAIDGASTEIFQEKGEVIKITTSLKETMDGGEITYGGVVEGTYEEQKITVKVLSGDEEGKIITLTNDLFDNPFDIEVKDGDKVFLYAQRHGETTDYFIRDLWHMDGLILWTVIFLILVLIVGGKAGLKALASLIVSIFIIFALFLPLIKNGYPPVSITMLTSAVIILVTHLIITGTGKKSWAAMGGTLVGVIVAAGFSYAIAYFANLGGLGTDASRTLAANFPDFDFKGLLFAGIILGALGAVMDVGISISSGLAEVKEHSPNISRAKLIKSGFSIGKDIMGSMINTLIFAYIGSALVSIVLFYQLHADLVELLNYGFIAEEIARSLVGSLGLLATIPATAFLAGMMMGKK